MLEFECETAQLVSEAMQPIVKSISFPLTITKSTNNQNLLYSQLVNTKTQLYTTV